MKLTIKMKFAGLIIVMALGLAAVAYIGRYSANQLGDQLDEVVEQHYKMSHAALRMEIAKIGQADSLSSFIASHDQNKLKEWHDRAAEFEKWHAAFMKLDTVARERELLSDIDRFHKEYEQKGEEVVALVNAGNLAEANKMSDEALGKLEEQIFDSLAKLNDFNDVEMDDAGKLAATTIAWVNLLSWLAPLIVGLALAAIAYMIIRSVLRPLEQVVSSVESLRSVCITGVGEGIEAMANGDLTFKITPKTELLNVTSKDELGALATSINGIITQTKETIKTFETMQGTLSKLLVEDGGSALETAARQDLTQRVEGVYHGTFNQLKSNINKVLDSLDESLSQVAGSAEQVSSAAGQISSGAESLAQSTSEQASSIEEISSSLQEMASMAKQNVGNAKEARSLAEGARASAELGAANMQNLSTAIGKIKASADSTAKIVKTIDEIAFQTNLLALNAAVEAARAGDAGKGFAVVAEEVRNLAMRSAEAAKNTANLIEESVKNSESGVTLNEGVAANLREINEQVQKVSEMMAEISAASEQQNTGVEQINASVEQMNQVTQQSAANSEESASAAEELSGQSEELLNMVASFKLTNAQGVKSPRATRVRQPIASRQRSMAPLAKKAPAVASVGIGRHSNGDGGADAKKLIPFDDDHQLLREF